MRAPSVDSDWLDGLSHDQDLWRCMILMKYEEHPL